MKIKLEDGAILPTRAHDTDAGLDLYAREDKVVPAGGEAVFDTGVHCTLPKVYMAVVDLNDDEWDGKWVDCVSAGFLKSKSGLMVNHDITSDGLLDYGYTGSIHVKMFNHGTEDYHVRRGDKISQLVIVPVLTPTIEVVKELEDTERGDRGFGSTGR